MNLEQKFIVNLIHPNFNAIRFKEDLSFDIDWEYTCRTLSFHRLNGIAWINIRNNQQSKLTKNRILSFVKGAYSMQLDKARIQEKHTIEICQSIERDGIQYAVLKGVVIAYGVYKDLGSKLSGDLDLLIHPKDIQKISLLLENLGYIQGDFDDNGKIVRVSRRELLTRPLVSHEIFPFIKVVRGENSYIDTHSIDVHFSVDLMTGNRTNIIVESLLHQRIRLDFHGNQIYSLSWEDHLIFLCVHFYKEATNYEQVRSGNDLKLYKLCDIAYLLSLGLVDWGLFLAKTNKLSTEKEVYFSFSYIKALFGDIYDEPSISKIRPEDVSYLSHVFFYNTNRLAGKWSIPDLVDRIFTIEREHALIV